MLTSYSWEFVPVAGATFTDSGSGSCHTAPTAREMSIDTYSEGNSATSLSPRDPVRANRAGRHQDHRSHRAGRPALRRPRHAGEHVRRPGRDHRLFLRSRIRLSQSHRRDAECQLPPGSQRWFVDLHRQRRRAGLRRFLQRRCPGHRLRHSRERRRRSRPADCPRHRRCSGRASTRFRWPATASWTHRAQTSIRA